MARAAALETYMLLASARALGALLEFGGKVVLAATLDLRRLGERGHTSRPEADQQRVAALAGEPSSSRERRTDVSRRRDDVVLEVLFL